MRIPCRCCFLLVKLSVVHCAFAQRFGSFSLWNGRSDDLEDLVHSLAELRIFDMKRHHWIFLDYDRFPVDLVIDRNCSGKRMILRARLSLSSFFEPELDAM